MNEVAPVKHLGLELSSGKCDLEVQDRFHKVFEEKKLAVIGITVLFRIQYL